jgi:hypothetical protein
MRIVCRMDVRHIPICEGWGRVFAACGHEFSPWDDRSKPAYDAFDETHPDLYITTAPHSRAVLKCLEERRRGGIAAVEMTDPQPAADTFLYGGAARRDSLACDFAYVGNYRHDKRALLDAYVCGLAGQGDLKIMGRTPWDLPEYLGSAGDATVRDLYASATVSLNVSSSGRTNGRVYQILLAGGVCVSNPLSDGVFPADLVNQHDRASQFRSIVREMCSRSKEDRKRRRRLGEVGRIFVLQSHTYWHRCRDILASAGFNRDAAAVMEAYRATVPV